MSKVEQYLNAIDNAKTTIAQTELEIERIKNETKKALIKNHEILNSTKRKLNRLSDTNLTFNLGDFVEELATQWQTTIDNLKVDMHTTKNWPKYVPSKEAKNALLDNSYYKVPNSMTILVTDKESDRASHLTTTMQLDEPQKDGKTLFEHIDVLHKEKNGLFDAFDHQWKYSTHIVIDDYRDINFTYSIYRFFSLRHELDENTTKAMYNAIDRNLEPLDEPEM